MEIELCLLSLCLRRNYLTDKYMLKAVSVDGNKTISVLSAISITCSNITLLVHLLVYNTLCGQGM